MEHVGNGGQRRHDDAAGVQGVAHLLERDPSLARHASPQLVRVLLQQGTPGAANLGRGQAGAKLPVWRTRCISLMAAEALTAKRRAACRIALPPSTTRPIPPPPSRAKG